MFSAEEGADLLFSDATVPASSRVNMGRNRGTEGGNGHGCERNWSRIGRRRGAGARMDHAGARVGGAGYGSRRRSRPSAGGLRLSFLGWQFGLPHEDWAPMDWWISNLFYLFYFCFN